MNHPLAAWIEQRMAASEFAKKIGISRSYLSLVLQGKRGLSLEIAVRIEQITDGEFSAARLLAEQKSLTESAGAA